MRSFDCLRLLLAGCALTGVLAASSVGHATGASPIDASAAQKKEATDHFMIGRRALAAKDWGKAISELRASLQVVDSPNAHLELARALRDSGELGEAWVEYWRAAETATRLAPKDERYAKTADVATSEREEVAAKLAFVDVSVANAAADMTLRVGGRIVSPEDSGAPVVVSPGPVDVVVLNSAGVELARRTVNAVIGQTTAVALDAQPPPSAPAAGNPPPDTSEEDKSASEERPQPSPPPAPAPADRTKLRPLAYVAGGLGVAGFATFAVFGSLSNSTYDDLKTACPHGCPPGKQSEIDRGIAQQTAANIGLGVGIAGLVAGATIFFLTRSPDVPGAATAVVVAPGYLGVRGSL
jgi:hypothetical protein